MIDAAPGWVSNARSMMLHPETNLHRELRTAFLSSASTGARARFSSITEFERFLCAFVEKGREAWPDIHLDPHDFIAFLGRSLPESAADELASLHANDLWLVCGYARGVPRAIEHLETTKLAHVARALRRLGASEASVADILQDLRGMLIEMNLPVSNRKLYAGRGDLSSWLRVCAVRKLSQQRDAGRRELELEGTDVIAAESPECHAELALLLQSHKRQLTEAFQQALATMSNRERNVLRYYFVDGLTIDQIGALYRVHRSTMARWVNSAREALALQTRAFFQMRVSVSEAGFLRLLGLIESRIAVELTNAVIEWE